jgi:hypothetical protein
MPDDRSARSGMEAPGTPRLLVMPPKAKIKGKKVKYDSVNAPPGLVPINDHVGRRVGYCTPSVSNSAIGSVYSQTPMSNMTPSYSPRRQTPVLDQEALPIIAPEPENV